MTGKKEMRAEYTMALQHLSARDRDVIRAREMKMEQELRREQNKFELDKVKLYDKMEKGYTEYLYKGEPAPAEKKGEIRNEAVRMVNQVHQEKMEKIRDKGQKAINARIELSLTQRKLHEQGY